MDLNAADYLRQLQDLLPSGDNDVIWPRDNSAVLTKLLQGFAAELARVDQRGFDLLREADPRTTSELITDWERIVGLPDPCRGVPDTLDERRAALVGRLVTRSDQSPAFYRRLIETLGYIDVEVLEFRPFLADYSNAGDACCESDDWRFVWEVRAAGFDFSIRPFRTGLAAVGEPLRDWGFNLLVCALNQVRPSHTLIFFETGV